MKINHINIHKCIYQGSRIGIGIPVAGGEGEAKDSFWRDGDWGGGEEEVDWGWGEGDNEEGDGIDCHDQETCWGWGVQDRDGGRRKQVGWNERFIWTFILWEFCFEFIFGIKNLYSENKILH